MFYLPYLLTMMFMCDRKSGLVRKQNVSIIREGKYSQPVCPCLVANLSSYCKGLYRIIIEICNQGWLEFLTSFLPCHYVIVAVTHVVNFGLCTNDVNIFFGDKTNSWICSQGACTLTGLYQYIDRCDRKQVDWDKIDFDTYLHSSIFTVNTTWRTAFTIIKQNMGNSK